MLLNFNSAEKLDVFYYYEILGIFKNLLIITDME